MNVFILSTGRCGSLTLARACSHISNYSSAHESRTAIIGPDRLDYPENHIESDNRLAWFLGRLDARYGDHAIYVHLQRDPDKVASSYARRLQPGMIIPAYANGIHFGAPLDLKADALAIAHDYIATVTANIEAFLKNQSRTLTLQIETAASDFPNLWHMIDAQGNLEAALAEFLINHNAS